MRTALVKEQHVFTGCAGTNILRLLPPLTLTMEQAADFMQRLRRVINPSE
jgi:acetylornithine aminotransferase